MNQFPHYRVAIPDEQGHIYSIHFMAIMSEDPKAIPLLLSHGWPGSFLEFLSIIPILAASKSPSFHLIVPSLPGFGFSSPPPLDRDIEPLPEVTAIFHKLMTGLGFSKCAFHPSSRAPVLISYRCRRCTRRRSRILHLSPASQNVSRTLHHIPRQHGHDRTTKRIRHGQRIRA